MEGLLGRKSLQSRTVVDEGNSFHSFSEQEKNGFIEVINHYHKSDKDLTGIIPIKQDGESLFGAVSNGILLCKMINAAVPGTIFVKAINVKKNLNVFQIRENLTLAINSAAGIGCRTVGITSQLIIEQRPHIILGLVWQILKNQMLADINLKDHPELFRIKRADETLKDLLKLPPEELLLRWFNYHLENAGHNRRVENFGSDLKDGVNYTVLLNQLNPDLCDKSGLNDDPDKRSEKILTNSKKLGVYPALKPKDITSGNTKLNLIFCSEIFNTCPGLKAEEEEIKELAKLLDDDIEGTREERSFRMWINSLGIEGVHVENLYEDVKDGILLLKVMDKVQEKVVDWKKVENTPNHRIKKVHNCNMAVTYGKDMRFSLVGIGGVDISDGNKKLTLALVWQLVKKHTLNMLGNWTEEKLIEWANDRVGTLKINSFKDKSISSCKFLFKLLATIDNNIIDYDIVTDGETPDEIQNNSKYVIAIARKLGAVIFLVWENIRDVNPKMIMTLIGALAKVAKEGVKPEMPSIHKSSSMKEI